MFPKQLCYILNAPHRVITWSQCDKASKMTLISNDTAWFYVPHCGSVKVLKTNPGVGLSQQCPWLTAHFGGQAILDSSGHCTAEYPHWTNSAILWLQSPGLGVDVVRFSRGPRSCPWSFQHQGLVVIAHIASSPKTCLCLSLLFCSSKHLNSLLTLLMRAQKVVFLSYPALFFWLLPLGLDPTASSSPAFEHLARPSRMGEQVKCRPL